MSTPIIGSEGYDRISSLWEARLLFGVGVGRWTDWDGV